MNQNHQDKTKVTKAQIKVTKTQFKVMKAQTKAQIKVTKTKSKSPRHKSKLPRQNQSSILQGNVQFGSLTKDLPLVKDLSASRSDLEGCPSPGEITAMLPRCAAGEPNKGSLRLSHL